MKKIAFVLFACAITFSLSAQNVPRRINFKMFGRDSVNLPLNDEYYLIEDSCAQITRYGYFDVKQHRFYGTFKDVSVVNPKLVVSEGLYTPDGLKEGPFIIYYLNGKLHAKGSFKNDKYDGHWEVYYDNGQPQLMFDASDSVCHITDAWDEKGKKTVDKGAGTYYYRMGEVYWTGKMLNGTPDGTWRFYNGDDVSETVLATEHFKKGAFRGGSNNSTDYSDHSRINLMLPIILSFTTAERLEISPVACDGSVGRHKVVNAQYPQGREAFHYYIDRIVNPYFSKMKLSGIELVFDINGEVSEKGDFENLKIGGSGDIGPFRSILVEFEAMPTLQPATVDGKPVRQQFTITFSIENGYYRYKYEFHRIHIN